MNADCVDKLILYLLCAMYDSIYIHIYNQLHFCSSGVAAIPSIYGEKSETLMWAYIRKMTAWL